MIKVIIYVDKFENKSARLVADLGYKKVVLSWDLNLCAELLKCCVNDMLSKDNGEYIIK